MNIRTIFLASTLVSASYIGAAQFSGKLVNHSQNPIINAQIVVRGTNVETRSDDNGNFTLDLAAGTYTLDIKAGNQGHFHQSIVVSDTAQQSPEIVHIDDNHDRKLVITANPLEHTRLDMAAPAIVLSGDELTLKRASGLGDILKLEPGMSVSSFGPAVSRPVIRGLSGGRVLMTINQMTLQDASTTSADHDVSVEPLLVDQIEVIKGPATLLYGSGAIGGVVNVTDAKINPSGNIGLSGGAELRLGDSATSERSIVATLNGGNSRWAWHLDGYNSEYDDMTIPGHAESHYLLEQEGEEEEHAGSTTLENSFADSNGGSFGLTYNNNWGYLGFSVNRINKLYGVPGHGEHEEEEPAAEPHAEEGVAIDLNQTRYDLQSEINAPSKNIARWFIGASYTDYRHQELEGDEIGTEFNNEAYELRSFVQHQPLDGWEGIVGLQISERDFSAIGEEAFVPPSTTKVQSLFWIEEKSFNQLKVELGARIEQQNLAVSNFTSRSRTGVSLSAGTVYSFDDRNKLAFNFARAERHPSVEEGFSFGEHAATQTFEIGNPELEEEHSNNIDISYRFSHNQWEGEINAYWNQFNGFIYGDYVANNGAVLDLNGQIIFIDPDLPVVQYRQDDAAIRGVEIQVKVPLVDDQAFGLSLGLMADFIEAELENGAYLPRIPPMKLGAALHFDRDNLLADLNIVRYSKQDKQAINELPTDGFTIMDLEVAYRINNKGSETLLFLRGKNLLDEEARDHASFIKDLAPRAGRNWLAGVRYQF